MIVRCSTRSEAWILYLLLKNDPDYVDVTLYEGERLDPHSHTLGSRAPEVCFSLTQGESKQSILG